MIAVAIVLTSAAWLVRVAGAAVRVIATSQHAGFLFGLWAGLLWLYVVSDIVFAEVARAQGIGGPETRWPVLLSAGLGIAAAVAGIGLIRSVMTHAASTAQATQ